MYMIHTCPDREWYVNRFLVPSLTAHGISKSDIIIYNDENKEGNLKSCINSFKIIYLEGDGDTWHLQDDVVISSNFKERIVRFDKYTPDLIMCGMCMNVDEDKRKPIGIVSPEEMWYSFQCIRIPNKLAGEFVKWMENYAVNNPDYRLWIRRNKYDDTLFREFMINEYPEYQCVNIYPNLVDHVDYLLGGSLVNQDFPVERRAEYFIEQYLVKDLEMNLRPRNITMKLKEQIERLNNGNKRDNNISRFNRHTHRFTAPDNYNGAE